MAEYSSDPQDERPTPTLREVLAGYAIANEFMEAERIERLAVMTDEEARAIDDELHRSWRGLPAWTKEGLERLEHTRLESLLAMRQAFDRMVEARNPR